MIQPLRTDHRRIFLVLAVVAPAVFVAGLVARPRSAPAVVHREAVLVAASGQRWKNQLFILKVSPTSDGGNEARILPKMPIVAPDVLVYYSETASQDSLPANAHLLGRWDPSALYRVPSSGGFLVVYSGAQKSVLDFVPIGGRP